MIFFANLDLLTVGLIIVLTSILGFTVYFNNKASITSKVFLMLCIDISLWGISNYFAYRTSNQEFSLYFIRLVLFFAVIQSLLLFELLVVFPEDKFSFNKIYKYIVRPIILLIACLTLTPFIFSSLRSYSAAENLTIVTKGPLWVLFPIVSAGLVLLALLYLIYKIFKIEKNKQDLIFVFCGVFISYLLIIIFNLTLPILFDNTQFLPLGPAFLFPFIAATSFVILRSTDFKLKATKLLVLMFGLSMIIFFEVVFSISLKETVLRLSIFLFALIITILVLKTAIREIQQRQKIQELNELKSEFISFATHEISTPLTVISGYLSILEEDYNNETSTKTKEIVEIIKQSSDNLINVIKEFLEISRLDKDVTGSFVETIRLNELVQSVVTLNSKFNLKQYHFHVDSKSENNILVNADRYQLEKAIYIILDTMKKSSSGEQINIYLSKKNNMSVLSFETKDLSQKVKNITKYGISFYIAKRTIEAYSGKLDLAFENSKLTITITVPLGN